MKLLNLVTVSGMLTAALPVPASELVDVCRHDLKTCHTIRIMIRSESCKSVVNCRF